MVDLVIVGSVAYDSVQTPHGAVTDVLGGAATYAAVAASFFAKPGVVAVVGSDFSDMDIFHERGISTDGITVAQGRTFRWSGSYVGDMNNAETHDTQLNVFERFEPHLPDNYKKARSLFLANIDPELQLSVLEQMKPRLVIADTMNFWIEKKREQLFAVIRKSNVFLLNDAEARQLCSTPNLVTAGRKLLSLGLDAAVIKKGEHGVLLFTDADIFTLPAYPLEHVHDPTGAGDSFAGAFTGYLTAHGTSDEQLRRALAYSTAVASFNVEDFSLNRLRALALHDIEARCKEIERMVRF